MAEIPKLVGGWLQYCAVEKGLSTHTIRSYKRDMERYLGWLKKKKITDVSAISAGLIEQYYADIQKEGLAPATTAHCLSTVRNFHAYLLREDIVGQDTAKEVSPAKAQLSLPHALSQTEVATLINEAKDQRELALFELLYGSGCRVSEAVELDVDDIYRYPGMVVITGKGNKQRVVPLGSKAMEALDAYVQGQRGELVKPNSPKPHRLFLNNLGRPLTRNSAYNYVQAAAKRAKITKKVSPHTLRHSFATHLLEGGASVLIVSELLGHSNVRTTQLYTHLHNKEVLKAHELYHPRS
ncbi:MAG: tyrosine recombinase [Corynebacterium sp.]|nr:tyrosine recombinase [Corynebacterium sp.]